MAKKSKSSMPMMKDKMPAKGMPMKGKMPMRGMGARRGGGRKK